MVTLTVRVTPRASKPGITGTRDGALLVRLQSSPVEGAANSELVELMAGVFGVPKRGITIVSGERSRLKRIAIAGIETRQVNAVLRAIGIDCEGLAS